MQFSEDIMVLETSEVMQRSEKTGEILDTSTIKAEGFGLIKPDTGETCKGG